MANANGWGDGSVNNSIGWGKGAINNSIGWGSSQLTSWSGATDIDGGNAPTNTVAPAITGTAQEGQTLTCSTGTWTGSPTYTYQWKRNGNNITSATNSTYTLVTADVGQSVKCTVTATNILGSANADSNTVTPTASTDADAQAFITAAGITDNTQKSAINQLVVDLKGYNIWTKFKAIYPIVGGTASSHKWNLKDPRDLDAAFRLTFANGWTHSSTGMTPNGATYANTFLKPSTSLALNSTHISYYSRTNTNGTEIEMGAGIFALFIEARTSGVSYYRVNSGSILSHSDSDSRALYLANRNASSSFNAWKNGVKQSTVTATADTLDTNNIYIGALGNGSTGAYNSTKQCAFASIGDGLTDTEAANFYTAVQAYQTTLGRSIGTQTVSDADAQAFVTAANITDQVEANAINNLVIGMKADGLWTKMKAIYPVVGGVSSSHAVNLKSPGTYNLTFSSGWTHSSTGMLPNGTSAYADTNMPANTTAQNSSHLSYYSRSNTAGGAGVFKLEMGILKLSPSVISSSVVILRDGVTIGAINSSGATTTGTVTDTRGHYISNRESSTSNTLTRNGSLLITSNDTSVTPSNINVWIGARNSPDNTSAANYTDRECAFASMGDGLTSTERTNLYNRVNTFQVTLNRNV